MSYQKIVLKIGTNVITQENGRLDLPVMKAVISQIAALKKRGVEIVVVSSGAMGAGRGLCTLPAKLNDIAKRQILAAVGQPALMHEYLALFSGHQLLCAQVLATKEDFRDRGHYLNMRNCFEALLKENITPIVNENDVVSIDELMFTENDELAGLIASMLSADALLILTTVEGVMAEGALVPVVRRLKDVEKYITPEKSSFGRGGMLTKVRIAEKCSKLGITTHIVNGKNPRCAIDVLESKPIGTVFQPEEKKASRIKQWIAQSEGREQGTITVNAGAEMLLRSPKKAVSLLPVGVTAVQGQFQKGELLKIISEAKKVIGYGIAQYDATKALETMGKKGKKELIHYNYLFIQE